MFPFKKSLAVLKDNMAVFKESLVCKNNIGFLALSSHTEWKCCFLNDYVAFHENSIAVFIKCVVFSGNMAVLRIIWPFAHLK